MQIPIAILQFAPAAVGLLLVVVVVNLVLRNISLRLALSAHEIVVIYLMILVAALLTSRGLLEKLIPALVAYNYYATPANNWAELFFHTTPQWAVPFDVEGESGQYVVSAFYEGLPPGAAVPWEAWVVPLVAWFSISLCLLFAFACLATILRRQWVDNERLTFPLTQLPLELARNHAGAQSFFRNKLMWLGFLLPTIVFAINGLHAINPTIPGFAAYYRLNPAFEGLGRAWGAMGYTYAYCSMAAVGFCLLSARGVAALPVGLFLVCASAKCPVRHRWHAQ